jgi:glycosyltransferase involved in cell wall biosynthesis
MSIGFTTRLMSELTLRDLQSPESAGIRTVDGEVEMLTIDIVVPSFRARSALLRSLSSLRRPPRVEVSIIVVVDRPGVDTVDLYRVADAMERTLILVNESNVGVSESRNRGINIGTGDYVLFLDDDVEPHQNLLIEYAAAIRADKDHHAGFVGIVRFPPTCNGFTRGLVQSGVLTFFGLAEKERNMPWGVTANLCIRRVSLGATRFSNNFPKGGGGEDIDFCLRVRENDGGRKFVGVANARVDHPWWGSGSRCYRRFVRWAYGDSRLPALHPQHRFINWPTTWETCLALCLLWPFTPPVVVATGFIASVASEFVVELIRGRFRRPRVPLSDSAESVVIRLCIDFGRILSTVSRFRPRGFLEHFDFFCTNAHVRAERRAAGLKTAIVIGALVVAAAWRGW